MRRIALALVVTTMAGAAAADDKADAFAAVKAFVDGINQGNVKGALAICASPASVVDDVAPYAWHGPTACADWRNDFDANARSAGITPGEVSLASPRIADVNGDRAYLVVPAKSGYTLRGKKVTEEGATFTVALQKQAGAWRITGWSWSRGG